MNVMNVTNVMNDRSGKGVFYIDILLKMDIAAFIIITNITNVTKITQIGVGRVKSLQSLEPAIRASADIYLTN